MKKYGLVFILSMLGATLFAQVDTAYMRREYTPTLQSFQKINQNAEINDPEAEAVTFDYYITPKAYDVSFTPTPIKPAKLGDEFLDPLYRNYLKVGFGTTLTPLLQFYAHNLRSKKMSYGINIDHLSHWAKIKGYGPTGASDSKIDLGFKYFFGKDYTMDIRAGYNHLLNHYYGFQTDSVVYTRKDAQFRNEFHAASASVKFGSNYTVEDKRLKQNYHIKYDFITGLHQDKEHGVKFNSDWAYDVRWMKISGSQNYKLKFDFEYFQNNIPKMTMDMPPYSRSNRFLIGATPLISTNIKEYHINVGINLAGVIDKTTDSNYRRFKIHPIVELQLGIVPGIMNIYANITGKTHYTSYLDIIRNNPYVIPDLWDLRYTDDLFEINGGLRGNLFKKFNYHLGVSYTYCDNALFFVLDSTGYANRYRVFFDKGSYLKLNGNFNWEVITSLMLGLDVNYQRYWLKKTEHAPYTPNLEFKLFARYRYKDLFTLSFDSYMAFFNKAAVLADDIHFYNMKPYLDFNLGFEYHITRNFNAFLNLNNIACLRNAQWFNYPTYRINGMVGISYSFGKEKVKEEKKKK